MVPAPLSCSARGGFLTMLDVFNVLVTIAQLLL